MTRRRSRSHEIELDAAAGGLWHEAWHRLRHNSGAMVGFGLDRALRHRRDLRAGDRADDPRERHLSRLAGRAAQRRPRPLARPRPAGARRLRRIVYGARYSLLIGVVSVPIGLSIGLLLGSIAGYVGGVADSVVMRADGHHALDPRPAPRDRIVAMLGPGLRQIMIAVGVVTHPDLRATPARLRARAARERLRARRALVGVPRRDPRLAHPPELDVAGDRRRRRSRWRPRSSTSPGLAFSGSGRRIPLTPEWGTMLTDTTRYLPTAPHLALIPGLAIVISVLGFNLSRRRPPRSARPEVPGRGRRPDPLPATRPRPARRVLDASRGTIYAVNGISFDIAPRRDARDRRRVRLRQERHRARDAGLAAARRAGRRAATATFGGRDLLQLSDARDAVGARPRDRDDLPGSDDVAESGPHDRRADQ